MEKEVILQYIPLYQEALLLTLRIGWQGVLLAFVFGAVCTLIRQLRIPVLKSLVTVYIEVFRNTPLLVQLFFLYFALPKAGIRMTPEFCGSLGLGLLGGAYMTETFRSGLESIAPIQEESALSLGMTPMQALRYVILPQAATCSMAGIVANVIFLLKETSVFSVISLMDLMFTAKDLIGMYAKTLECLTLLVIFYLIMLLPVSIFGSWLERRMRRAEFGT